MSVRPAPRPHNPFVHMREEGRRKAEVQDVLSRAEANYGFLGADDLATLAA